MFKKCLIISLLAILVAPCFLLSACGNVVPTAWVYFKADTGYVTYGSDMYGVTRAHIYYYENEADATDTDNSVLYIYFSPRIMGVDTEKKVDGVEMRTTTVDITSWADMDVYIKTSSAIYDAAKKIYINGVAMEEAEGTSRSGSLAHIRIINLQNKLTRGNPDGHENDVVNVIEYK